MIDLILNDSILDHNSKPVVSGENKVELRLGDTIARVLPYVRTTSDSEVYMAYGLLEKISDHLKKPGSYIQVTEEEFQVINQIMAKEPLIVKYNFLVMVKGLNQKTP